MGGAGSDRDRGVRQRVRRVPCRRRWRPPPHRRPEVPAHRHQHPAPPGPSARADRPGGRTAPPGDPVPADPDVRDADRRRSGPPGTRRCHRPRPGEGGGLAGGAARPGAPTAPRPRPARADLRGPAPAARRGLGARRPETRQRAADGRRFGPPRRLQHGRRVGGHPRLHARLRHPRLHPAGTPLVGDRRTRAPDPPVGRHLGLRRPRPPRPHRRLPAARRHSGGPPRRGRRVRPRRGGAAPLPRAAGVLAGDRAVLPGPDARGADRR